MSNRLEHLLSVWQQDKDTFSWVLATVVETSGSSYRKPGAMMLINSLGQYYGLLSGGCLESDLMRQAKRCMASGDNVSVTYDMREDSDITWQLGIGCGGMVKILLQVITPKTNYLELEQLQTHLAQRQHCLYIQQLDCLKPNNAIKLINASTTIRNTQSQFVQIIKPAPLLAIIGGGVDARPVCELANSLGWQTIIIDERVNYAVQPHFPSAKVIYKNELENMPTQSWFAQLDAIAIMTHNIELDGRALKIVQQSKAKYIGLLGPSHRTDKVLSFVNLTRTSLTRPLSNPIGLDIGGELPESIALSILSEIHAVLENKLQVTTQQSSDTVIINTNNSDDEQFELNVDLSQQNGN